MSKTTFICHLGSYWYKRMPFGLTNAPAEFQRIMDIVLDRLHGRFLANFLDDILIYSHFFKEHLKHIQLCMDALASAGLRMNREKSHFLLHKVTFLGHQIGPNGNQPDHHNMDKIRKYPVPMNVPETRGFLGLVGYYRQFIQNYGHHAEPLQKLIRKSQKHFEWNQSAQEAFEFLKSKILEEPILRRPDFDKPFILYTDASDFAIGGILGQLDKNGQEHVVKYLHKTLSQTERKYGSSEREGLAAVWCIQKCKAYLIQQRFQLITDNFALKWIFSNAHVKTKFQCWQMILSEYKFDIVHKPGKTHLNADALSRLPL